MDDRESERIKEFDIESVAKSEREGLNIERERG